LDVGGVTSKNAKIVKKYEINGKVQVLCDYCIDYLSKMEKETPEKNGKDN